MIYGYRNLRVRKRSFKSAAVLACSCIEDKGFDLPVEEGSAGILKAVESSVKGIKCGLSNISVSTFHQRNIGALSDLKDVSIFVGNAGEAKVGVAECRRCFRRSITDFTGECKKLFLGIGKNMFLHAAHVFEHAII